MSLFSVDSAINFAAGFLGDRKDPMMTFKFSVEVDGLIVGGFQDVSGLSITVELLKKKQGGFDGFEEFYYNGTSYLPIILSRGMVDYDGLYEWFNDVSQRRIKRKNATIYIMDQYGDIQAGWDVNQALPVKWEGPSLSAAATGGLAVEKITLAHSGIVRTN